MKEIATRKPLVIGLIGLPGAGKSTFGSAFSTMFGAPSIEASLLQREIFGAKPPTREQADGLVRAYWNLAGELFKSNRMFVLDGYANTYGDRSEIRAQAKAAGYDVLFVWVQTNEMVAGKRAVKPKKDSTNTPLSAPDFARLAKAFEPPRASEDHVVLSGQRTFASQIWPVLMKIAEGRETAVNPPAREAVKTERQARKNIFIR